VGSLENDLGSWKFGRLDCHGTVRQCTGPGAPRVTHTGGFWTNHVTKILEVWWERRLAIL